MILKLKFNFIDIKRYIFQHKTLVYDFGLDLSVVSTTFQFYSKAIELRINYVYFSIKLIVNENF